MNTQDENMDALNYAVTLLTLEIKALRKYVTKDDPTMEAALEEIEKKIVEKFMVKSGMLGDIPSKEDLS